ncbi:transcriptional activator [Hyphodiscus hymeniophilus]|uniref:Transcriptional activator n=1 Tax=Hyphodiscus hymeniophilus TaxID=353542 RepID=A0A9P6SNU6_9HELO|nr:transcriptional activator [Hyphodiscus hymeniophilus]
MLDNPVSLYDSTRRMLESLEANDNHFTKSNFSDIEHVQARVLLCIYEFLQTNPHRGWMSSGRCFRLLQLMRLHQIDTPENVAKRNNDPDPETWIRTEEKRRTFWIAYTLDRFISLLNEWPLMLDEHTICTRLPASEEDFRVGHGVEMPFLSEAMIAIDQTKTSPLTENFWDRHQWHDEMLKARAATLCAMYPSVSQDADCMLLFANMILHTTILCLGKAMESVQWQGDQYQDVVVAFKQRCLVAAKEIVNLSRSVVYISYFKVHPFTPLSLILCAEFFNSHRYLDESVETRIQEVHGVLREMGSVNNLAQNYFLA